MKRNGSLVASVLLVLTFLGVSNSSKTPESVGGAEAKQSPSRPYISQTSSRPEPNSPCVEIRNRLARLINDAGGISPEFWKLPESCYKDGRSPAKAKEVRAFSGVAFEIATVPNPVSTHLSLMFDRIVEAIQHAEKDEHYSYDSSWFPWDASPKDYPLFVDQQSAKATRKLQESQPGLMVFRRSEGEEPYKKGLLIFLVGEQPTGGIDDEQFDNAIKWIARLQDPSGSAPLGILGPTFSGSLPSLQRDLGRQPAAGLLAMRSIEISSGTVSSWPSYNEFDHWAASHGHLKFHTAIENDSLIVDRFCRYLAAQGYETGRVAFLSEDETAFGELANPDEPQLATPARPCSGAARLSYPRDIALLRSAYQTQSILVPAKPPAGANGNSTTLRGDLSEPSGEEHDTVHSYAGQLTPLAQESVLLDISARLSENRIQFIVLRSTSSLDQIFLSEFLRRSYPSGRVVIDGADLLFTRGAEGRSLRGVMLLSTYPLLSSGTSISFGEDTGEAIYIAARKLSASPDPSPVFRGLAIDPNRSGLESAPATWLSVISHSQFWPLAVLTSAPQSESEKSLVQPIPAHLIASGNPTRLRIPITMWMFLIGCLVWSAVHAYFCSKGSLMGSPRARAYFAPLPHWQHPALIALSSLFLAMLTLVMAAATGLFSWPIASSAFEEDWGLRLACSLLVILALVLLAGLRNYNLSTLQASPWPGKTVVRGWQYRAGLLAAACLAVFLVVHIVLISKLSLENKIPAFWRSVNLTSGVSPLLPQLLFILGAYLWCWCNLRGLAHFGDDRPLLPKLDDLPMRETTPMMPMFSREHAGEPIECAALPMTGRYLVRCILLFAFTMCVWSIALQSSTVRTLGERRFGNLIFFWVCLFSAAILADAVEIWLVWTKLRRLLTYLDMLPLRRTAQGLHGLAWGSVWKMSGNVLEGRYRVISLQLESLRHLQSSVAAWSAKDSSEASGAEALSKTLEHCRRAADHFGEWFVTLPRDQPVSKLRPLRDFQNELALTAGTVLKCVLLPSWRKETGSLIFSPPKSEETRGGESSSEHGLPTAKVEDHVRAAEEFVLLPYLAFVQNILGRIRTTALGSLWLFVAATLAVSSYPFDPLNILGGIFLTLFVVSGGLMFLVYSQMSRDATLSHIANTRPGELGWEFWQRLAAFGIGPLMGLLTTLFPTITDFVFSWLQPSAEVLK